MMEFLEGEPLSRRLARERLRRRQGGRHRASRRRARWRRRTRIEIVHRDLKPENLFLVPDPMSPGGERVKVLDFGIAKLRPDWSGSDGAKTRTGVIFGTPAYMSPEQCRGLNDEVDGATDIYALGCILFEMLCGRAPYVSPGWGDVLMMHMSDDIPVPSAENPRVHAGASIKVVRTALAKKKADRFASMRDMHRALAQARNDVEDTPAPLHEDRPGAARHRDRTRTAAAAADAARVQARARAGGDAVAARCARSLSKRSRRSSRRRIRSLVVGRRHRRRRRRRHHARAAAPGCDGGAATRAAPAPTARQRRRLRRRSPPRIAPPDEAAPPAGAGSAASGRTTTRRPSRRRRWSRSARRKAGQG